MKYKVQPSTRFTKDLKLCKSRGWDTEIIKKVIKKTKMTVNPKIILMNL